VTNHLSGFLADLEERDPDRGVPSFVKKEFERFATCGILSNGFARFRCDGCKTDRLVPFSCKGRGFCPSCTGRRMIERSAFLVDRVLPHVPVRHWVLSLPFHLRYRLAFDHVLCRAVLAIFARELERYYRGRARARGWMGGRSGSVTAIQRAGSALNLNIHFHTLALDGVFREDDDGSLRFHSAGAPSDADVARVLGGWC
jgi:hypothetical protein